MTRVLVVDDQNTFRLRLANALATLPTVSVCGEATNGREAVAATLTFRPDLVLMDIRMPVMDGIAATYEILRHDPKMKVVFLTTFAVNDEIKAAVTTGAYGYIFKDATADELGNLIALTCRGYSSFAPGIMESIHGRTVSDSLRQTLQGLTDRERAVLRELSAGATNKDIASILHIADGTVRNYVSRILTHLGVRTRTEAALVAHAAFERSVTAV